MQQPASTMRSYRFRHEREASWQELEELLDRAESQGLKRLDQEQLFRLPVLYRAVVSSLSVARAISLDKNVITYLESLAARAYGFVYGAHYSVLENLVYFFTHRYRQLVWQMRGWVVAAAVLMAAGVAVGFLLTADDPERFSSFVSDAMAAGRSPLSTRQELLDVLYDRGTGRVDTLGAFASFLFSHNARIGLSCFAAGIAAGVPVALLLFINGLTLGAFAALYARQGIGLEFWAWVLPHGITELLAVCLCGAAGFKVGAGLLFPGRLPRLESLIKQGREAAAIVIGTLMLFLIAAMIEGFFRQLVQNEVLRLGLALATTGCWTWYFTAGGGKASTNGWQESAQIWSES
jgi:uncharacterized membrane protein SpoIIM required for sporulation